VLVKHTPTTYRFPSAIAQDNISKPHQGISKSVRTNIAELILIYYYLQVLLSSASLTNPLYATVLAEVNSTGALDGGYILNLTVPGIYMIPPAPDSLLMVVETYYSYYVPLQTTVTSIPIKF
jgi:hypothetical protein